MFVDRVEVFVKGGDGGAGCRSFRREKYVPKGGPDGGDGGDGGSVLVRAVAGTDSLAEIVNRKFWRGERGGAGGGANCHGRRGIDLVIPVPPGTIVLDRDRGNVLRDLTAPGDEVNVARGGRGGRGNKAFATATNRAPRETQPGTPGEERWLTLELKVIADAGVIGLPNAGKSTLLAAVSAAHPKIAPYPFTTLTPNLGRVQLADGAGFSLADVPGLIEGAHLGHGLGIRFLRHLARTRVLIYVLDLSADPERDFLTVRAELAAFDPMLSARPALIALNKLDLVGAERAAETARTMAPLAAEHGIESVFVVSAEQRVGLKPLVATTARLLEVGAIEAQCPPR